MNIKKYFIKDGMVVGSEETTKEVIPNRKSVAKSKRINGKVAYLEARRDAGHSLSRKEIRFLKRHG